MDINIEISCKNCDIKEEIKIEKDLFKNLLFYKSLTKSKKFNVKKSFSNELVVFCKECNKNQFISL